MVAWKLCIVLFLVVLLISHGQWHFITPDFITHSASSFYNLFKISLESSMGSCGEQYLKGGPHSMEPCWRSLWDALMGAVCEGWHPVGESPLLRLWGGEWRGRSDRVEVLWTHYNPHSPSHCAAEMWGRGRRVRNKGENLSLGRMWGEREVFQFSVFLPILLNFTYQ